jgi:hypothetical protein
MPTNSEMFDRGVQDAEHDELNHFYYQHYYYYRRGYDQARRQERSSRRHPLLMPLLTAATLMALVFGAWQLRGLFPLPEPATLQAEPPPTVLPVTVAAPTAITPNPTATTAPTVAPTAIPTLAVNGRAMIENLNGAPLRARTKPGIRTSVVARIPEGSTVFLREGPVEADGYTWWRIEFDAGSGWVAERSPEGIAFLRPLP